MAFLTKENSNVLYLFALYFLYFNTIVCNAQDRTSDSVSYKNLPIVYNVQEECKPQLSSTCPSKAWHINQNIRFTNHLTSNENMNIEDCFNWCLSRSDCTAVLRKGTGMTCWIYNSDTANHQQEKEFTTYYLTCCELTNHRTYSYQDKNNFPIVFSSNFQQLCKPLIGVAFNKNASINSQSPSNSMCQNKAFVLWEKKNVVPYKFYRYKNILECMDECIKDVRCKVFSNFVQHNLMNECKLSEDNANSGWSSEIHGRVFQLTCCKLNDVKLWTHNNSNLMMLYHPKRFCKTISTQNEKNCKVRIWHVEDEMRMKKHFKIISMDYLENCLKECLDDPMCFSVSVDWTYVRCLLFARTGFEVYYAQVAWTSYTLKCCDAFNDNGFLPTPNGTSHNDKLHSDAAIFKNLQFVYNLVFLCAINLLNYAIFL